ncbi:MAG: winged helix-turn-helix domain-containing protein [Bryobacteraceae bacterium]
MSTPVHDELRVALDRNPEGLRPAQLMEDLFWEALEVIVEPSRDQLAHLEVASSDLARHIFSRTEPGSRTWRLWYAGQLQGLAGLLHARLSRHLTLPLETAALLESRKHARAILNVLIDKDFCLSDLAKAVYLDESHLRRELKVLADHNLIATVKEGRERWVRITEAGRVAVTGGLEDIEQKEDILVKCVYINRKYKKPKEELLQYKDNLRLLPMPA